MQLHTARFYVTLFHQISDIHSLFMIFQWRNRGVAKSNFRRLVKPYTVDNGVIKHKGKEVLLQGRVEDMLKAYHDNKYIYLNDIENEKKHKKYLLFYQCFITYNQLYM